MENSYGLIFNLAVDSIGTILIYFEIGRFISKKVNIKFFFLLLLQRLFFIFYFFATI